ncbi:CrcB-like domain-containing protein [Trichoderma novae-zelandiae]
MASSSSHEPTPGTGPQSSSTNYNAPTAYQNLDDGTNGLAVDVPDEHQAPATAEAAAPPSPVRQSRRASAAESPTYDIPDDWANLDELAATSPVENVEEASIYRHRSLEQTRSRDRVERQRRRASVSQTRQPHPPAEQLDVEAVEAKGEGEQHHVSRLATQIYTISYLVFFAIWGTLARVGLTALTTYPGVPVVFNVLWANFGGSLIMGFLSEDRMLFRYEWGMPTYDQVLARAKENGNGGGSSGQGDQAIDLAAAKKAHLATKKTIPLYIGLATGFCGSFTSFSSFIRDIFLALSDQMVTPGLGIPGRNGGYSFMALLAVTITTVSLSLSGLIIGAHLAIALERLTPSIPYPVTRRILDPLGVLLGWGCWLGAVLMAIFPPHDEWRGEILFALVFAPLGCLARFYLAIRLNAKLASFPLGTFAANVGGTAVLGMAWDIAHARVGGLAGCQVLQGVEDGFCGCLTTVSTWVAELSSLGRRHSYVYGFSSVAAALTVMIAIMGGLRWSDGFSPLTCVS